MSVLNILRACLRSKSESNSSNNISSYQNEYIPKFSINQIPLSIKDLLIYLAREGVAVTDLFRRPGNTQDINFVINKLKTGENIDWNKYNFYTLANIAKRFLLHIENGVLGKDIETQLLQTLELPDDQTRIEAMSRILAPLSDDVRKLLALLFGIWFRMIYHSDVNAMSVEAVAKSVAGSVFPSVNHNPSEVNRASKVMEYLITGFANAELFGKYLIEYFTNTTQTSISRIEKFRYEFVYPKNVPKKKSSRLFVRMLLEESFKHEFDIFKDEVSEKQFNALDNCIHMEVNSESNDKLNPSFVANDTDPNVATVNNQNPQNHQSNGSRKRRSSKPLDSPLLSSTSASASVVRHSNPIPDQQMVQQTSEKRTCVTATVASGIEDELPSINGLDLGTDISIDHSKLTISNTNSNSCLQTLDSQLDNQYNRQECVHNRDFNNQIGGKRRSNEVNHRSDLADDEEMKKLIYYEMKTMEQEKQMKKHQSLQETQEEIDRTGSKNSMEINGKGAARFSQVKNLQMKRLQMRSNWFLSTPAGCKSDELMQLSPTSSPLPETSSHKRFSDFAMPSTSDEVNTSNHQDEQSVTNKLVANNSSHISADTPIHIDTNNTDLSDSEIDIRYFVVRRYYGPQAQMNEE